MQVRLGFELLSSLTDAESTVPYIQRMQSIPVITSCQREGYLALDSFCPQGGTSGSWPDSWLTHLDRSHEANLTHSGGVFQRGRCFKIHNLTQMEPKFPSHLVLTLRSTKDTAQPKFFFKDVMAMYPSPVLAPLHVSVSGTTLLSHRLGTL